MEDLVNPWHGRRVLITGHTGFKGGWLSLWLASRGAVIRGFALDPTTQPNLFQVASVASVLDDVRGDIREYSLLAGSMRDFAPRSSFIWPRNRLCAGLIRIHWARMPPTSWEPPTSLKPFAAPQPCVP